MKNKKQLKKQLKQDTVNSDTIHVGIELELIAPGSGDSDHDYESCAESYDSMMRDDLESLSVRDLIERVTGERLSGHASSVLERYLDTSEMVTDELQCIMNDFTCDDSDCGYHSCNEENTREELETELIELTGNSSFKVVSDGSINHDGDEVDAEVCWNYFVSTDTVKDNKKIMDYLNKSGVRFNTSCGLHINLNNYLNIEHDIDIPTRELDFLFNVVAPSRQKSSYCNTNAIASKKYSMLFNQGDRIEFRFFSPTLNAEKLNHYVRLAHHIYKRLAGINSKLPKKSIKYFEQKMQEAGHPVDVINSTLKKINSIKSYQELVDSRQ